MALTCRESKPGIEINTRPKSASDLWDGRSRGVDSHPATKSWFTTEIRRKSEALVVDGAIVERNLCRDGQAHPGVADEEPPKRKRLANK